MKINNNKIFCDFLKVSQQHETLQTPVHSTTGSFETLPDGTMVITYKGLIIEGLHFSKVIIKSQDNKNTFDGNISKWNRSEAVHGYTLDEVKIAINIIMRIHKLSPFFGGQFTQTQNKINQALIYNGAIISRIDMVITLATGSPYNRDKVLDHIQTLTFPKLERLTIGKNTYYGKKSDSRTCRIYDKSLELMQKAFKTTDEKNYIKLLAEYLDQLGTIRIEWEYHRFLRKADLRYWNNATHKNLCEIFIQDINIMTKKIKALDFDDIPTPELGTLMMYMSGIDVKKRLHRNTFTKHKKVLKEYGYDISNQNIKAIKPKTKTIVLTIAEVPDFYKYPEKPWELKSV